MLMMKTAAVMIMTMNAVDQRERVSYILFKHLNQYNR